MPNHLAHETSLYLRQHAENPVDWSPWGDEAFARARAESKPVLLSVGYSACHWCHVMAHESFEDAEIARIMNARFINIKVDREERPDLDQLYQTVCQVMTGSGGWPLTVFLTPDREPFYVGTYFPKTPRDNLPGFAQLLTALSDAYAKTPEAVRQQATALVAALRTAESPSYGARYHTTRMDAASYGARYHVMRGSADQLRGQFDGTHGGFGTAPKFPMPTVCQFLLRAGAAGSAEAGRMACDTLRAMACGGIYDQIGGGFHRYSVDAQWLVPHFEKMLYDNALLIPLYVDAFRATSDPCFAEVAIGTVNYLCRAMRAGDGFASSQDADTEHEEGKFYTWTWEELQTLLPSEQLELVARVYGATPGGNFEGKNIFYRAVAAVGVGDPDTWAGVRDSGTWGTRGADPGARGADPELVDAETLAAARHTLFTARNTRTAPARNEQIITAWNAFAMQALAQAGMGLGLPEYIATAESVWSALRATVWAGDHLFHVLADGRPKIAGLADDYAAWALASYALFEATGAPIYLEDCVRTVTLIDQRFWDPERAQLYLAPAEAHDLIVRPRAIYDQPTPSATALFAECCFRLGALTGIGTYRAKAEAIWNHVMAQASQNPVGYAGSLAGMALADTPPLEIVIIGPARDPATTALVSAAATGYHPERLILRADPATLPAAWRHWPLLQGRLDVPTPTAFLCRGGMCQEPTIHADVLRSQLPSPLHT